MPSFICDSFLSFAPIAIVCLAAGSSCRSNGDCYAVVVSCAYHNGGGLSGNLPSFSFFVWGTKHWIFLTCIRESVKISWSHLKSNPPSTCCYHNGQDNPLRHQPHQIINPLSLISSSNFTSLLLLHQWRRLHHEIDVLARKTVLRRWSRRIR